MYGSNRGAHDSITMFRVEADGWLTRLGHRSTEGKTPRNFTLTPDGRFRRSRTTTYTTRWSRRPIDAETGLLGGPSRSPADVPTPACVRFAPTATVP